MALESPAMTEVKPWVSDSQETGRKSQEEGHDAHVVTICKVTVNGRSFCSPRNTISEKWLPHGSEPESPGGSADWVRAAPSGGQSAYVVG